MAVWIRLWWEHMQTPIGHEPSPERAGRIIKETLALGTVAFLAGYWALNHQFGPHTW